MTTDAELQAAAGVSGTIINVQEDVVISALLHLTARSVKLLVKFRELWMLVRGLMNASTMFYTCVLVVIVLYVLACVGVEMVGPNVRAVGNGSREPDPECQIIIPVGEHASMDQEELRLFMLLLMQLGFALVLLYQVFLAEVLYTLLLCFVVLNVAMTKKVGGKHQFYVIAIGFVVIAGGYGAGHISGGFTVGFGAVTPATGAGKVFGAFWIVFGCSALVNVVTSFTQFMVNMNEYERYDNDNQAMGPFLAYKQLIGFGGTSPCAE